MLREMDYSQITIKELTHRAMINRKTFYLHYHSLDELLGKLQTDIYAQVLELPPPGCQAAQGLGKAYTGRTHNVAAFTGDQ